MPDVNIAMQRPQPRHARARRNDRLKPHYADLSALVLQQFTHAREVGELPLDLGGGGGGLLPLPLDLGGGGGGGGGGLLPLPLDLGGGGGGDLRERLQVGHRGLQLRYPCCLLLQSLLSRLRLHQLRLRQ